MEKDGAMTKTTKQGDRRTAQRKPLLLSGNQDTAVCRMQAVRSNSITKAQKDLFFDYLSETSNVTQSALAAGIGHSTVKKYRRTDSGFAQRWDRALADGIADLRMRALEQARFGQRTVQTMQEDNGLRTATIVQDIATRSLRLIDRFGAAADARDAADAAERQRRDRGIAINAMLRFIETEMQEVPGEDSKGDDASA